MPFEPGTMWLIAWRLWNSCKVAMHFMQDRKVGIRVTPILNHHHPTITIHARAALEVTKFLLRTYTLHAKRVRRRAANVLRCNHASRARQAKHQQQAMAYRLDLLLAATRVDCALSRICFDWRICQSNSSTVVLPTGGKLRFKPCATSRIPTLQYKSVPRSFLCVKQELPPPGSRK